jgi:hypothetical protein
MNAQRPVQQPPDCALPTYGSCIAADGSATLAGWHTARQEKPGPDRNAVRSLLTPRCQAK